MDKKGKKIENITRMFIVLSIFTLFLFAESSFAQISMIESPEWYIVLNDAGYADIMIQQYPGQVMHENLSGEWAAAIRYNGISTPGGVSMWLTPLFVNPEFTTNSTFSTVTPLSTWDDPNNPTVGNDTGYSKISNGVVAIDINYKMHDTVTGTAVGLRPGGFGSTQPVISGRYVLEMTYKVTNISNQPLTNVCFFQFLHAHPNDDWDPNNYGVYDPTQYAVGAFQNYRYDLIQYGASILNPPGSDITGFSSAEPPLTWGIGDFPAHDGEPPTGLHFNVYNDTLPLNTVGGPAEIAGAMKWCYGTLPVAGFFNKSVLLYNGYTSVQIPPPPRIKGDFNGDRKSDVLWRHPASGTVAVWIMNGTAISSIGVPGAIPSDWQIKGVGDFNGDGKADVLWQHPSTGTVAIWIMNGAAISSIGVPGAIPSDWQIKGIGDFDGDAKADVLWQHPSTGTVAIWIMNGTTISSIGVPGAIPSDWQIKGVGDFDGNGKADVLWQHPSTGTVAIWIMNGAAISSIGVPGAIPSDWQIKGVGDFDGDGKSDVLWQHPATGTVAIWIMNGSAISSIGVPGAIPSDWQIMSSP